jgi:hypothetical protein
MSRRSSGEGSVFRKRDDLWGAHLTLPNGKRKYFYAKTRKDVVEKLRIARIKMERGQNVDDDKRTVGEYLRWWLQDQRQHLAYETWRGYESKARIHLIPAFDNIRLARLSPIQVREFVAEKMSSDMSSRHVNNIFDVLHAALEDARRMEIVERNVASLVDTPKITSGKRTALTAPQAMRLLKQLEGVPSTSMRVRFTSAQRCNDKTGSGSSSQRRRPTPRNKHCRCHHRAWRRCDDERQSSSPIVPRWAWRGRSGGLSSHGGMARRFGTRMRIVTWNASASQPKFRK